METLIHALMRYFFDACVGREVGLQIVWDLSLGLDLLHGMEFSLAFNSFKVLGQGLDFLHEAGPHGDGVIPGSSVIAYLRGLVLRSFWHLIR